MSRPYIRSSCQVVSKSSWLRLSLALAELRKLRGFISMNVAESSIMSRRRWGGAEAEGSFMVSTWGRR
jgi:hypothetical protein